MTPKRGALLAIDLGSTAVKVLITDVESGAPRALIRQKSAHYSAGEGGVAEQDPDAWWRSIVRATNEALARAGDDTEILGITAVGHGPTLVPVRADGSAAAPAMLWSDRRAASDDAHLAALLQRSGWLLAELPKARWFLRERAEAAGNTAHLLSTWDSLAFRLSGEAVASFWDPARGLSPADRALLLGAHGGLDERALPPEVHPGTKIGLLRAEVAEALGLRAGTPVVSGTNDGLAAVVGAGLMHLGRGVDVGGAAGGVGVSATAETATRVSAHVGAALWSGPAPTPFGDVRILGGALGGTGLLLDEAITSAIARGARPETLMQEVANLPLGEFSLSSSTSETLSGVQRVRAAAEHGALAVEALLAPARAAGLPLGEMWLSGPATGATVGLHTTETQVPRGIRQMRADLLGVPVVVPRIAEAAAAGAAAIAGVGAGIYASLSEAADLIAVVDQRIDPDPRSADAASAARERFRRE